MFRILIVVLIVIAIVVFGTMQWYEEPKPEFVEISSTQVDGNAEIIQASADGMLLAYTNAINQSIGFADLSDPFNPLLLGSVDVPGEPTSVALSPDGNWALATVHVSPAEEGEAPADLRLPGVLVVVDLQDRSAPRVVSIIGIDNQPDSIALSEAGDELVAVIAIENEEVYVKDGRVVDTENPGDATDISPPGVVQIVRINPDKPRSWSVATLEIPPELLTNALMLNSDDPQPEYVTLSPGRHMAAVSLQENNGLLLVDLATAEIAGAFNLGAVSDRPADLKADNKVSLTQKYPADVSEKSLTLGTRNPDSIAFSPDGQYVLSADEGEAPMTGGRGISIWSLNGELAWDDGGDIEKRAAAAGLYPDERSEKKGVEMEGIAAGRFGSRDFVFAVSERGSFLVIYDISNPYAPEFVDILPTGTAPESVIAIPSRNLVIVAAEESGMLTVFRYESAEEPAATNVTPVEPAEQPATP
ncbi:MAG: hypothetical protein P8Y61_06695 [Gammaproteobacteria bacterium]|jgi:DNA-binding beta-propeller fold protein YncE